MHAPIHPVIEPGDPVRLIKYNVKLEDGTVLRGTLRYRTDEVAGLDRYSEDNLDRARRNALKRAELPSTTPVKSVAPFQETLTVASAR